jgi:hypothetical protein
VNRRLIVRSTRVKPASLSSVTKGYGYHNLIVDKRKNGGILNLNISRNPSTSYVAVLLYPVEGS